MAVKHFCKCFILHVTTVSLQRALNMQKHLQNILEVVTCKIKH